MRQNKQKKLNMGFTLVEVIVGVSLLLIVFMGVFGVYRLGLKVVGMSKAKITATAIANQAIEMIRNLPYASVGTIDAALPYAVGTLERTVTQTRNGIEYAVATKVQYASDPADGEGADDPCNLDYKKAEVTVSWISGSSGHIVFSTDVTPETEIQELQSCTSQPGGLLKARIFNAFGIMVPSPVIDIYNAADGLIAASASPADGEYSFLLPVGVYKVVASKPGYSSARTYDATEVAQPDFPNLMVFDGAATETSLSIDRVGSLSIDAVAPTGQDFFTDSFESQDLISDMAGTEISGGAIKLSGSPYNTEGNAVSVAINPASLVAWNGMSFADAEPAATGITYQILYDDGSGWMLVPDSVLGGNSGGFGSSPVNLTGLPAAAYPRLKIKANLTTSDTSVTPEVAGWEISWTTSQGAPIGGAGIHLRGEKIIGKDSSNEKVYKYSSDLTLDAAGHIDLPSAEWDSYTITVSATSGLDVLSTNPNPQPIAVSPGGAAPITVFLRAQNSLLVTVRDQDTLVPIFSAGVHLYNNSQGYDKTQYTDEKGQTLFIPLQNATYSIEVQAIGYLPNSDTAAVSGDSTREISLSQAE